jgi:hypothetical protein
MKARKKSPALPRDGERDISGKLLAELGFERAHKSTGLRLADLDPVNQAIWFDFAEAVAAAVRRKDAVGQAEAA